MFKCFSKNCPISKKEFLEDMIFIYNSSISLDNREDASNLIN